MPELSGRSGFVTIVSLVQIPGLPREIIWFIAFLSGRSGVYSASRPRRRMSHINLYVELSGSNGRERLNFREWPRGYIVNRVPVYDGGELTKSSIRNY